MRYVLLIVLTIGLSYSTHASAAQTMQTYHVQYTIAPDPENDRAKISINIDDGKLLSELDFNAPTERYSNFQGEGQITRQKNRLIWMPPVSGGTLTFFSKISHLRKSGTYDAYCTEDFALLRGDDMIPSAKARIKKNSRAVTTLQFDLPKAWPDVSTGWPKKDKAENIYLIDNPTRQFDRPVGWMIMGKIGSRLDRMGMSDVVVAAPKQTAFHRMDALALLNVIWPEAEHAFGKMPPKMLIVSHGDPMWRGALSSPNSLFLHADRPLISENGTSTLIHELTHVATRIRGQANDDWIAEGLAEFYAIELLYRAGALAETRYKKVKQWLQKWSRSVTHLRQAHSTGKVTARAVLLFQDLDAEIRQASKDKKSLDDVTRILMKKRKVSLHDLQQATNQVLHKSSSTLENNALLK